MSKAIVWRWKKPIELIVIIAFNLNYPRQVLYLKFVILSIIDCTHHVTPTAPCPTPSILPVSWSCVCWPRATKLPPKNYWSPKASAVSQRLVCVPQGLDILCIKPMTLVYKLYSPEIEKNLKTTCRWESNPQPSQLRCQMDYAVVGWKLSNSLRD